MMSYFFSLILIFLVFSVVALGMTFAPHQGVIALMGVSFFCCMLMVLLGRTFAALVMYIVYLGGLVVVFSYCVSVEKGNGVFKVNWFKYVLVFLVVSLVCFCGDFSGLLVYSGWEDLVCLEVNGGGVFYCVGGAGLVVCSWGLVVVLFSILIVLGWSRLGGLRPF